MRPLFNKQRWAAVASIATSLLFAPGCRSASVNPGPSTSSGTLPFYRPFDRSPQSYDNDSLTPTPAPQPAPPSVLPVPGYSEPEVPPAPSAQKSRWKMVPSNFKMPSLSRPKNDVNQTAAKVSDHPVKRNEEVVLPRMAPTNNAQLAPPELDTVASAPRFATDSSVDEVTTPKPKITPLRTPIRTRHGVIEQWPSAKSQTRNESDSKSQSTTPIENDAATTAPNSIPFLLPPNN